MMLSRRWSFLARNVYSLCRQANINQHKLPCQITGITRFSSMVSGDQPELDPKKHEDLDRKLAFIKLEMGNMRDEGHRMPEPDLIKPLHWEQLLKCKTMSARMKYYHYLFIIEKKKENEKIKKEEKKKAYLAFKEQTPEENPHITYSLYKTTFLLRIYNRTMDIWRNNRLIRAMQFGQKIIFDCSYDQYMTRREANSAAKQLMISFADNRRHKDPFDLHFCNVNFNGETFNGLQRYIPNLRSPTFPTNLCEGSYLDLFPKDKLVYLTPHCRNDLTDYDPDSIYIIGAMVDTKNHEPLSMIKAKELNLKMARLPLDRYLDWGSNSGKTLTLDQMMKIMLEFKMSRKWDCALKHVPRRKIVNDEFIERKVVTQWNVNVNKFKKVYRNEENTFDDSNEQSPLSIAEKFKKNIGRDNDSGRNIRMENSNFKRNFNPFDSTVSTADKVKKLDRTGSKITNTGIDVQKLFSK